MAKLITLRAHTDSQRKTFNFYQILEYTFQRSSFFEKNISQKCLLILGAKQ